MSFASIYNYIQQITDDNGDLSSFKGKHQNYIIEEAIVDAATETRDEFAVLAAQVRAKEAARRAKKSNPSK